MLGYISVPVANLWSDIDSLVSEDYKAISENLTIGEWFSQLPNRFKPTRKRVLSQVLYGEPVQVEENRGEWLKVYAVEQATSKSSKGYPGYLPARQVAFDSEYNEMYMGDVLVYIIQKNAILKKENGQTMELSFMTKLPLVNRKDDGVVVFTPEGGLGFIKSESVILKQKNELNTKMDIGALAKQFHRVPFIGGGTSFYGYDCSGLLFRLYESMGISIPRDIEDQFKHGQSKSSSQMMVGDTVFFCTDISDPTLVNHAGLYIGEDSFISARRTGLPIKISSLQENFYRERLWGVKRFT